LESIAQNLAGHGQAGQALASWEIPNQNGSFQGKFIGNPQTNHGGFQLGKSVKDFSATLDCRKVADEMASS